MTTATIFITTAALAYLIFTIRYSFVLLKSTLFTGRLRTFHQIMIWIIPFLWILILQALSKTTPGSHEVEHKKSQEPYSDAYDTPKDFNY